MSNDIIESNLDELNGDRFTKVCHYLLESKYEGNFIPGPKLGSDDGIDGRILRDTEPNIYFQYKWRHSSATKSSVGNSVIRDFRDFKKVILLLEDKYGIFIINLSISNKYKKIIIDEIKSFKGTIELWDFERLSVILLDPKYRDFLIDNFPVLTREEVHKVKKENKILIKENETNKIYKSLSSLFVDNELKFQYYSSFIYFFEPFYLDDRNKVKRENLRSILNLTNEDEKDCMKYLLNENIVKRAGNLCTVNDEDKANSLLSTMFEKGAIDLKTLNEIIL